MVKIKKNKKYGRYIVAEKDLAKGILIEVSEMIVLSSKKDIDSINNSDLYRYVYSYGKGKLAIALGVGSLFNHSFNPNVDYIVKPKKIYFKANKLIKKGEQLFIDYGYDPTLP